MVATDDNPYRSPSKSASEARKPTPGPGRVIWEPLALHALATLNWGVAVAWLYWEALKPGYPLFYDQPPGMQPYVAVSACVSLFSLPMPGLIAILIGPAKGRRLRRGNVVVCVASLFLSGLQLWLFRIVQSPPIHAI